MAGNRNGGKKDIVHVGFSNIFPDLSVHRSAMNFLGFAEPAKPQALSRQRQLSGSHRSSSSSSQ